MITIELKSVSELVWLRKLMIAGKFMSHGVGTWHEACSPITGELVKRIFDETDHFLVKENLMNSEEIGKWSEIDEVHQNFIIENIKNHLINISVWNCCEAEEKKKLIEGFFYPFTYNSQIIEKLVEQGDKIHSSASSED